MPDDSLTAGGGPIQRKIGEKEVTLAELSFYDRSELAKEFRKQKRAEKAALLKETVGTLSDEHRVEVQQMLHDQLAEFDTKYTGDFVWFDFFNSDEGKLAILEKSLKNAGEDPGLARKYAGDDVTDLCATLSHTPITKKQIKKGDGDKPNPQTPNSQDQTKPKGFGEE